MAGLAGITVRKVANELKTSATLSLLSRIMEERIRSPLSFA